MTNPVDYIIKLTGLTHDELFNPFTGLVELVADADHNVTVLTWNVPGIEKPTTQEIAAAISPPSTETISSLKAYASRERKRCAALGINVTLSPGRTVFASTDDDNLAVLNGLLKYVEANTMETITWVVGDGAVELRALEVVQISIAAFTHIQKTFKIYASTLAAIKTSQITTQAEIDAAFTRGMAD